MAKSPNTNYELKNLCALIWSHGSVDPLPAHIVEGLVIDLTTSTWTHKDNEARRIGDYVSNPDRNKREQEQVLGVIEGNPEHMKGVTDWMFRDPTAIGYD